MEKKCNKCNNIKLLEEYYKDKSKKDGYENRCKNCVLAKKKIYYQENKEKRHAYEKKRYHENEEVRIKKYDLGVPDYKSKNTKKILIIGNSHGRDLFNALILNKNLFPEYEFSILDTQIYCLENIEINNSICNRKIERNLQKIFTESEVVILSSLYNDKDINSLENAIKILKYNNKKIILTTINPTFSTNEKRLPVDEFFLQNKRLPNLQEKLELEKKYYHLLNEDINLINKKLFHISNKYNITILDKHNLLCSNEKKSCLFLTPENNKIFYDSNHYTIDGAIFIGSIIKDLNWLKIN
jgi:hypothetical protein